MSQTANPIVGADAKLIHDGEWRPCRIAEITPEQALLETEENLAVGASVVACIAELGAFAGDVVRAEAGRYAVAFRASPNAGATAACYGRA